MRLRLDARIAARVDASDIVQEAFLDASRRLNEFSALSAESLFGRLKQLAYERAVDACRRHMQAQRRSVLRELPSELPVGSASRCLLGDTLAASTASAATQAARREELERVGSALDQLAAADRELLVLRHIFQLEVAELAEMFGTTRTVITTRHLRAIKRLRRILCMNPRGNPQ